MIDQLTKSFKEQSVNMTLIGTMIVIYLIEAIFAGSFTIDSQTLFDMGAQRGLNFWLGDWWRLITAAFLHVSFLHIFMNLLVMYYIGKLIEVEIGHWQYLFLFIATAIGGNIVSLTSMPAGTVSAGASGAIFGMFGAIIMLGLLDKRRDFWRSEARLIAVLMVWTLISSIFSSNVDIGAHVGGAISGFILVPALLTRHHYAEAFQINPEKRLLAVGGYFVFVLIVLWIAYAMTGGAYANIL
jgi:rhomboid protease GluP